MKKIVISLVVIAAMAILSSCATGSATATANASAKNPNNSANGQGGGNPAGLTQDQMTAYRTAVQANLKTELDALVAKGTITQDQANSILSASTGFGGSGRPGGSGQGGQNGRPAQPGGSGQSTPPAQPGGSGQNTQNGRPGGTGSNSRPGPFGNLGLSQDQMTAVRQAQANASKDALASLVKAGTITQAQADQLSGFGNRGPGNGGGNSGAAQGPGSSVSASN
ncbi:MAG: hypothetical protein FWF33_00005 [Clostridiales bacterium]|nr:hypothetical protein [Clostridiales bacterium]